MRTAPRKIGFACTCTNLSVARAATNRLLVLQGLEGLGVTLVEEHFDGGPAALSASSADGSFHRASVMHLFAFFFGRPMIFARLKELALQDELATEFARTTLKRSSHALSPCLLTGGCHDPSRLPLGEARRARRASGCSPPAGRPSSPRRLGGRAAPAPRG